MINARWLEEFDVWSSPILANMLWVLFSIPVLTMPLALSGLLAVMYHWVNDRHTQVFSIFFNTIRKTWRKSYLLAFLDLIVGGFLCINLLLTLSMDLTMFLPRLSLAATGFSLSFFIIANVPAWVMVAVWDVPLKRTIIFSVQLVFANTIWMMAMGICFMLPFLFSLMLPAAVFITATGAIAAAVACYGTTHLMQQYLPKNQIALIDVL